MTRALVMLLALTGTAAAHSWYPYQCCHERDCAPVRDGRWKEVKGGWQVTLVTGEHPAMNPGDNPVVLFIRYQDAKPSPDGQPHVCINPATKAFLCAFWPFGGA